jgi:hypothetical protein
VQQLDLSYNHTNIYIDSMMITLLAATKPEWIKKRLEPNN